MVKHILSGSNANRMIAAIISLSAPTSLHPQKAWGMIVEVKDVPEAIDTPSKYARYIFIGKPDKAIQFLLMEQLKEDPNWK